MKLKKEVDIKIPKTPNFILCMDGNKSIPIQNFTDAELKEIGEAWLRELLLNAQNKRNRPGVDK